jgi:hypothetical protein
LLGRTDLGFDDLDREILPVATGEPSGSRPMQLRVGDHFTDETAEYEVISRPYTTNAGKSAHVRVKRVHNAEVTPIRTWAAHEHQREGRRAPRRASDFL